MQKRNKKDSENRKYLRDGRAPIPQNEFTSRVMSAIKSKNTKPEMLLRSALWKKRIRGYRLHKKDMLGRPDIVYVGKKTAIFVHGCYWHRCPHCNPSMPKSHKLFWRKKFHNNIQRDKEKETTLRNQGWNVLVFWECQIKKDIDGCVRKIKKQIKRT